MAVRSGTDLRCTAQSNAWMHTSDTTHTHAHTHTQIGDLPVQIGDVVHLPNDEEEETDASAVVPDADALLGLVVCLFEEDGEKMAQVCESLCVCVKIQCNANCCA